MKAKVAIIMGSDSDWPIMEGAAKALEEFSIPFHVEVVSAHRTPEKMIRFAKKAQKEGLKVIIAGAGGAAHLPGMVASTTTLPVIGVPVKLKRLNGLDSLLSIVQMPKGVPVATVAINGSANAAILAAQILALQNPDLSNRLKAFKTELAQEALKKDQELKSKLK